MISITDRTIRVDVDGPEPVVAAFRFIDEINAPVADLVATIPGLIDSYPEPWMVYPFTIWVVLLAGEIRNTNLEIEFCKTVQLVTGEQRQIPLEGLGVVKP